MQALVAASVTSSHSLVSMSSLVHPNGSREPFSGAITSLTSGRVIMVATGRPSSSAFRIRSLNMLLGPSPDPQ